MIARIIRQIASLGAAEIVGRIFTFGFTALVARSAGIEVLGYLSLALALITYVTIAGDSGLNQDSTRRLIKGDLPRQIVQESVRIQILVASIASVIVVLVAYVAYGDPVWLYVLLLVPLPISVSMSTPYLLDYRRRIRPLVISRLVQTVSVGLVGMLLIAFGVSGAAIATAYGVGGCLSAAYVIWVSKAPYSAVFKRIDPGRLKLRAVALRRLGITGVLLHVFVSLPLTVAGFLASDVLAEMGLVTRIWFLVSAPAAMAGTVLLPVMSTVDGRNRVWKMALLGVLLGSAASVVVAIFSMPILVILFGEEASIASYGLQVFIGALPAYGVIAVASAYLVATHREKAVSVCYAIAIVVFLVGSAVGVVADYGSALSYSWLMSSWVLAGFLALVVGQERRRIAVWNDYVAHRTVLLR